MSVPVSYFNMVSPLSRRCKIRYHMRLFAREVGSTTLLYPFRTLQAYIGPVSIVMLQVDTEATFGMTTRPWPPASLEVSILSKRKEALYSSKVPWRPFVLVPGPEADG